MPIFFISSCAILSISSIRSTPNVEVRNGDFNGAMRKFKKRVQEAGIIQEIRERKEFVKPSEQRRKAKAAGRARWLKKQAKEKRERGY